MTTAPGVQTRRTRRIPPAMGGHGGIHRRLPHLLGRRLRQPPLPPAGLLLTHLTVRTTYQTRQVPPGAPQRRHARPHRGWDLPHTQGVQRGSADQLPTTNDTKGRGAVCGAGVILQTVRQLGGQNLRRARRPLVQAGEGRKEGTTRMKRRTRGRLSKHQNRPHLTATPTSTSVRRQGW